MDGWMNKVTGTREHELNHGFVLLAIDVVRRECSKGLDGLETELTGDKIRYEEKIDNKKLGILGIEFQI
jgi:hypothetical protein